MLPSFRKGLRREGFLWQVLTLMAGSTLSQALILVAIPLLTRLFTPEQFGTLALFTSLTAILAVPAAGRYELAIIPAESDRDAVNLLGLALVIAVLYSMVLLLVFWLSGKGLADLLGYPQLEPWLFLVPLAVLALIAFQVFANWLTRRQQYQQIAGGYVVRAIGEVASQATLRWWLPVGGLMVGRTIGHCMAATQLAVATWHRGREQLETITRQLMWEQARKCSDFPAFSTWAGLLGMIASQLPPLLLAYFFTNQLYGAVVGYYAIGHRVIATPMSIISRSVSQVFFQRASAVRDQDTKIAFRLWMRLLPLATMASLVVILVGPQLYALVLGSQWSPAGEYARWIAVWVLFQFVAQPLSNLTVVHDRLRLMLVLQIIRILLRATALVTGGLLTDPLLAVILFCLVSAAHNTIAIAVYIHLDSGRKAAYIAGAVNLAVLAVAVVLLSVT